MKKPIRVGITGGIGSGKSTVCRMFSILGVPVYDTDSMAKELMNSDARLKSEIIELFGRKVYGTDGLDRKLLASLVFSDPAMLNKLNGLVHPSVERDLKRWYGSSDCLGKDYLLVESAILFEAGMRSGLDFAVAVSSPIELRIERAARREGADEKTVRERMANQMDDQVRERLADYVVINDECQSLWHQVLGLDITFKAMLGEL